MSKFSNQARIAMVGALLIHLTGCGGGGDSPPTSGANPPAPVPAPPPPSPPPPAPPPPSPPPPPAPDPVPPLSSVVTNIDAGQTIGTSHWSNGDTSTGGQGSPVEGLECQTNLSEVYHVHTHVSIILDGTALAFPNNVGRVSQTPNACFYPIHTHDMSGKIHVEAPAPGTFTLGQLFAIWGQPLQTDNVAGLTGKPIVVYSTDQGTVTRVDTDWKAIELTTHKLITIQVGTPITEIPNFTWSAN